MSDAKVAARQILEFAAASSGRADDAGLLAREVIRLNGLINTPSIDGFLEAVRLEAAHQCERWGVDNDAGKEPADWFWLLGYLAGKALAAAIAGNKDKALHHTISTAAACLNWHASLTGARSRMRPGSDLNEGRQA